MNLKKIISCSEEHDYTTLYRWWLPNYYVLHMYYEYFKKFGSAVPSTCFCNISIASLAKANGKQKKSSSGTLSD